ncbi:MAG: hypothetical protein PHH47_13080 [Gallionella sp.]|nr:hypothetical protein [Gallionella sp.]MDD4947443.1 hypothetical protein [Gallionella sp.]
MITPYRNQTGGHDRYDASGAQQITSLVTAFRDDFPGNTMNAGNWAATTGSGQDIVVAGSELSINAGVVPNSQTTVMGKIPFTVPFRVWFIYRLSQRIANQQFYLEVVDASGTMAAQYLLDGTYAYTAKYDAINGAVSPGATVAAVPVTSADSILEIQLFPDECWFSTRAVDSASSRGLLGVRTRNIPDPNTEYYLRIRAVNGAIAPASNTTLTLGAVCAQDISELSVEVVGGQGGTSQAQAIPIFASGGEVSVTANLAGRFYADTATPLAAGATFTGTSRWVGYGNPATLKGYYANVYADQPGTLFIEMSNNNSTWRQAKKIAVLAGDSAELYVMITAQYYRARFVNGATAQTAFMLNTLTEGA